MNADLIALILMSILTPKYEVQVLVCGESPNHLLTVLLQEQAADCV